MEGNRPPVSEDEIESIRKGLKKSGPFHIALGYLATLRGTSSNIDRLTEIHNEALGQLSPGDDYCAYVAMHTKAFNFLRRQAKKLGITKS